MCRRGGGVDASLALRVIRYNLVAIRREGIGDTRGPLQLKSLTMHGMFCRYGEGLYVLRRLLESVTKGFTNEFQLDQVKLTPRTFQCEESATQNTKLTHGNLVKQYSHYYYDLNFIEL